MVLFGVFIPAEVFATAITGICCLLSYIISSCTSAYTCKNEIRKIRLLNEYEKEKDYNADFAEMLYRVSIQIRKPSDFHCDDALKAIETVRAKSFGVLSTTLDNLHSEIAKYENDGIIDDEKLNALLEKSVNEKRESDSRNGPDNH